MKLLSLIFIVLLIIGIKQIPKSQINEMNPKNILHMPTDTIEFSFGLLGKSSKKDMFGFKNVDGFNIDDWPLLQKVKSSVGYYPRDSAICWYNEADTNDSIMVFMGGGSFKFNNETYVYLTHENWYYNCGIECFTHLSLFKITADSLVEVLPIGYQVFETIACVDDFNGDGKLDLLQYCYNDTAWFSTYDEMTNRFVRDNQYYLILFRKYGRPFEIDRRKSKWFFNL